MTAQQEQGEPTPYDTGQREGFRRALEGEEPWFPIPGNPDAEYRGSRLAGFDGPVLEAIPEARVLALSNAVDLARSQLRAGGSTTIDIIVRDAHQFEQYLIEGSKE